MRCRIMQPFAALAIAALCAAGCAQTSRVSEDLTSAKLTETRKAVAVMRIGSASPTCVHSAVMIGQREGTYFKPRQPIS